MTMPPLNRIVVPVAAYTDPGNPDGAAGSVNLELSTHPMEHSSDYGQGYKSSGVRSQADVHSLEARTDSGGNRDEWTKKDWQAQARAYSLPTSGNLDTLIARVEEYEEEEN